jgi:hypothetical protein
VEFVDEVVGGEGARSNLEEVGDDEAEGDDGEEDDEVADGAAGENDAKERDALLGVLGEDEKRVHGAEAPSVSFRRFEAG